MNNLATADYVVVIGFFAVMIAVGLYFHGRMKSMTVFFGGGKQVPWWLAGISFYMCTFSAAGFVIYSALAYQYGWVAVTIWWAMVPCLILSAYLFASRWRRIAETSPLEYIEHRFDNKMRQGLVWLGLPIRVLDDGLKLLAIGTIVAVGIGFPLKPAIIVSGLIMISYTFMGGLWAALVADFIQFIVLMAAVIVLPFLAFGRIGGVSAFLEQAPAGFFALTTAKYSWVYVLVMCFIGILNYSTSWALVQRYYSVDSDKNACKVGYLVAFLNILGPPIFYVPAMVASVLIPNIPKENMNEVYAIVCRNLLPIGMLGMVIAAMFAATMSMLAGDFNAVASVLTNDVFKRMIFSKASNRTLLMVSRINTVIAGLAVIGITFMLRKAQGADDLIRVMVKIFGLFLPPVAIPMLLGMLTKRISNAGGLLGLWSGIIVGLIAFVAGNWYPVLRREEVITSITSLTTLLGMLIGTVIRPDSPAQREKVNEFFNKVNTPSAIQPTTRKAEKGDISPLPIIGIGVIAIGIVLVVSILATVPFEESILSFTIGTGMVVVGALFWLLAYRAKGK